jgi:hypothetical protein
MTVTIYRVLADSPADSPADIFSRFSTATRLLSRLTHRPFIADTRIRLRQVFRKLLQSALLPTVSDSVSRRKSLRKERAS